MSDPCPVIVMAKAPVPGFAKTRLVPALGADAAAKMGERLLRHAVAQALPADLGPVELCCAPDSRQPAFAELARGGGVRPSHQGEGDLGRRMARALRRALGVHRRVLMIGTDCLDLDATYLRRAADALQDYDAVFGPAEDGGYTLVGLRRLLPALFRGVAWSTPEVMALTRQRLEAAGVSHMELAPLSDVDEPRNLACVPAEWLV